MPEPDRSYRKRIRVRSYELDSFNHVNNAVFANYLQEAAVEASAQAGYSPSWYRNQNTGWVIHELAIRYHQTLVYGDELEVLTWVSRLGRSSCTREYLLSRSIDNARVARARAKWIYIDVARGRPVRIPSEIASAFGAVSSSEDLGIRLQKPQITTGAYKYRTFRRVQSYETGPEGHVNNAHYLRWIEQAYFDALRASGHPIEKARCEGWLALQGGHEIIFLKPARDNDKIEIVSWICEMGKVRGAWTHEIYRLEPREFIAREYSLGIFVNLEGRIVPAPADAVADVLRGPALSGVPA